ncbi:hypothetical protein AeMF1_007787, partial [Aphanomyces euteiches]
GLIDLALPTTAADLQQFVCATNWMRASIPDYNKLIDPLRRLLDVAVKAAGSSKKKSPARVALSLVGWSQDHAACFEDVKSALANVVPLSHPRNDMEVCVFTDASDKFWGAVATQILSEDLSLPLEDQRHEPLAFLSGTFTGVSQRWPIVEKEAGTSRWFPFVHGPPEPSLHVQPTWVEQRHGQVSGRQAATMGFGHVDLPIHY